MSTESAISAAESAMIPAPTWFASFRLSHQCARVLMIYSRNSGEMPASSENPGSIHVPTKEKANSKRKVEKASAV